MNHDELSGGLSEYVERLYAIGVTRYFSRKSDGNSVYFGPDDEELTSEPVHEPLAISTLSEMKQSQAAPKRYARILTDYPN
jgi:hypothetical protein